MKVLNWHHAGRHPRKGHITASAVSMGLNRLSDHPIGLTVGIPDEKHPSKWFYLSLQFTPTEARDLAERLINWANHHDSHRVTFPK